MQLGCSIPAKTFMPEYKGEEDSGNSFNDLLAKCRYANELGYDYVELSVGAVNELDTTQLEDFINALKNNEFRLYCCNSFVPPEIKICTVDFQMLETFVCNTMARLSEIGVNQVVFGSGYARRRPDNISEQEAQARMRRFLLLCSDKGAEYGITTCVEPLNSTETNIFTTVAQTAETVRELSRSNIKLLPDLFHMCMENENPEILSSLTDITAHLHASEAPGRVFPGKFGGEYLKRAAGVYASCGKPDVTVECVFDDFETEAKKAYDFMRCIYE